MDAAVAPIQLVGGAGLAGAHQLEGRSLPGLLLAHVLGDQHPADVLTQGAHRCARADGLELRGVAHHDQLGVVPGRERDQFGKLPVADHPRLVDDEHAAGWQVVDLELVEHAGDRQCGDVGTALEHVGGASSERTADDLDAGGLERLPAHVEGEGLAHSGRALDDHHAGRALADRPDHRPLVRGQRGPGSDGCLGLPGVGDTDARCRSLPGGGDHAPLDGEHLRRGVAELVTGVDPSGDRVDIALSLETV